MARKVTVFMVLFSAAILWGGNSETLAAKKYLSIGTGNPGGIYYFIGAGFANIFNKYVPEVRVIGESTLGGEENLQLALRGKIDIAMSSPGVVYNAVERKLDLSGIRLLALGHTSDRHWFVRKESPIKTILDFKGRKVSVGTPGSGTLNATKKTLAAMGLSFDDIKPAYLSHSESVNAFKDGTIDVGTNTAGVPIPSLVDLARQIPIRLISLSEEEMKAIMNALPYYIPATIPKGAYIGVEKDVLVDAVPTALFCRGDLSDDLVYRLMKALYEHPKERDAIHPQAKQWNEVNLFRGAEYTTKQVPFHAGAVRFLKEKGIWKENK